MGEVGLSTGENPTDSFAMNGEMNGSCDEDLEESMDVDPLESPINKANCNLNKDNLTEDDDEKSNLTENSANVDLNQYKNIDEKSQSSSVVEDFEDEPPVNNESNLKQNGDTLQKEIIEENDVDEIHDIPDSEDELEKQTSKINQQSEPISNDVSGRASNGRMSLDEDKPVSIHSDSDSDDNSNCPKNKSETSRNSNTPTKSNLPQIEMNKKTEEIKKDVTEIENSKNSDVHEILSDKEDCIVVEEDGKDKEEISPRRSQRQRKSIVKVRNFADFDDDDIAEITEDPLKTNAVLGLKHIVPKQNIKPLITTPVIASHTQLPPLTNQISIKDARSLALPPATTISKTPVTSTLQSQLMQHQQQINKKEPTLVIIDTNSILAGRGGQLMSGQNLINKPTNSFSVLPVGVPAQGVYPPSMRTSITPIQPKPMSLSQHHNITQAMLQTHQTTPSMPHLLPALTDDMFVLEAPSFIVPYIYEKPPSDNLKEVVTKMGSILDELTKIEETKQKDIQTVKEDPKVEAIDESLLPKDTTASTTVSSEADTNDKPLDGEKKKKKKKSDPNADESWDESDTSTDDEASDTETRTKVLIKDIKEDIEDIKQHIITPESAKAAALGTPTPTTSVAPSLTPIDPNKKVDNYFESPLGKFFMTIGINLVQEHVQTDLLRQQKKKRDRDGTAAPPNIQMAINSLVKNLELSRERNEPFKFDMKRCEYCSFKSESSLAMAHHYETPHMRSYIYRCNFCTFEIRSHHDILFHMEAVHNIKGRLEKAISYHQCPNCTFEDNGKSKLARHSVVCAKKFRPESNLAAPADWEPPAKIPRIKPKHGLVGTATAYQAMAAQQQRAQANMLQRQSPAHSAILLQRARANIPGRTLPLVKPPIGVNPALRANQNTMRTPLQHGMVMNNSYQLPTGAPGNQFLQVGGSGVQMMQNNHGSLTIQSTSGGKSAKSLQQPSISITPLPRQAQSTQSTQMNQLAATMPKPAGIPNLKPGQSPTGNGKHTFVICEICDGYIKDLDQLRNHMQWIHKIKIHPKMIYNRPPLNCQKCQYRFFTDQGLERHLLGSHGLVTSSMQEAANKGKDAGRCPVCGRVYQWKLLNHVSRDHSMTLKPAHLSYKCTVCTATFGMYKQFENHVYSAHSTVAKKSLDNRKTPGSSNSSHTLSKSSGDSLLKPLKINDEITIIPQPATKSSKSTEIESHVID